MTKVRFTLARGDERLIILYQGDRSFGGKAEITGPNDLVAVFRDIFPAEDPTSVTDIWDRMSFLCRAYGLTLIEDCAVLQHDDDSQLVLID